MEDRRAKEMETCSANKTIYRFEIAFIIIGASDNFFIHDKNASIRSLARDKEVKMIAVI